MSPFPVAARLRAAIAAAGILVALVPAPATATIAATPVTDGSVTQALTSASVRLSLVASGLNDPVFVTSANDGTGRLFIIEKGGRILVRKDGAILPTPFLDIHGSVSKGGEQGLLGLAFHPSFRTNHKFYVDFTNTAGDTLVREYRASTTNPDRAVVSSSRTLLRVDQPYANHNGGMLAFGPGGYLYIGMGDGGSGDDPGNRAQSLSTLLGKMLRIDVNGRTSTKGYRIPSSNPYVGRTGLDEIWQRGVRNPWRFSFDRATGNLWIGDVGQATYEEVDRATNSSSGPGRGYNWGWRVMEGHHCHIPSSGCSTSGKTLPIAEYTHELNGRCAITGGYVYRGTRIAALAGWYVYGDYCSGEIFAIKATASWPATRVTLAGAGSGRMVSSFGESAGGEIFVVDLSGNIYLIAPA